MARATSARAGRATTVPPPPARSDHGRVRGRARPPRGSGRPREGGSRSPRASSALGVLVATGRMSHPALRRCSSAPHTLTFSSIGTELRSIAPNPVTVVGDVLADLDTARLPCSRKSARRSCSSARTRIGIDEYAASRMSWWRKEKRPCRPAAAERAPCERAPPGTGRRLRGRPQRRALRPCLGGTPSCHRSRRVRARPARAPEGGRFGRRSVPGSWRAAGWRDLGRRPAALATSRDLGRRASRATPRRRADCRRTFG